MTVRTQPYLTVEEVKSLTRAGDLAPLHEAAERGVAAGSRGARFLAAMIKIANEGREFLPEGRVPAAAARKWHAFRPLMRTWVGAMAANPSAMRSTLELCIREFSPGHFEVLRHLLLHGVDTSDAFRGPGAAALGRHLRVGGHGTSLLIEALLMRKDAPLPMVAAHTNDDGDLVSARDLTTMLVTEMANLVELHASLTLLRRRGPAAAAQMAAALEALVVREAAPGAARDYATQIHLKQMLKAEIPLTPATIEGLQQLRCSPQPCSHLYLHSLGGTLFDEEEIATILNHLHGSGVDLDAPDAAGGGRTALSNAIDRRNLAGARVLAAIGARGDRRVVDPRDRDQTVTVMALAARVAATEPTWADVVVSLRARAAREAARSTLAQAIAAPTVAP